jgi:hypothetical protein
LHDQVSILTRPEARVKCPESVAADDSGINDALRQFFRPYVLAFLALAIAVGGNGYGYKLAQYLQHSEASKASATRMWVDHRDDSSSATSHQHSRPQRISAFELFALFAPQQLPRLSRDHAVATPAPARVANIISSHIPSRAPPALSSSLA